MKRRKLGKRHSRILFSRTAKRVHKRNARPFSMRGGYRL